MTTFQLEHWDEYYPECIPLWFAHYAELVEDKRLKFEPDVSSYRGLSDTGALMILTARDDGAMVGYLLAQLHRPLHFSNPTAVLDTIYLKPQYRRGKLIVRLLQEGMEALREVGVERMLIVAQHYRSIGRILKRLGFTHEGEVYAQWIGD